MHIYLFTNVGEVGELGKRMLRELAGPNKGRGEAPCHLLHVAWTMHLNMDLHHPGYSGTEPLSGNCQRHRAVWCRGNVAKWPLRAS